MTSGSGQATRNSFLDAVRAVAILRVLVWHTYGYAWISYFVASMPAMFFVAGSLMAHSLQRGRPSRVLFRRFRRLLIPLWLMAVVAIGVMFAYERYSDSAIADFAERDAIWWLLPVWDPQGSDWGITWWASLWYLRCLAWLMLASPLLWWLWQRLGPAMLIAGVALVVLGEERVRAGSPISWRFEDAGLYGFFWLLGFAYYEGRLGRLGQRQRLLLCLAFAAAAAVYATTQPVASHIVNASYPLHLLAGLAWLFGALTIEGAIGRIALRPAFSAAIYWVNERALTIYLWHAAGLFVMYQVLFAEDRPRWQRDLFALPIVAAVTLLAVLLFGWLEDLAAQRSLRLWPRRDVPPRERRLRRAIPVALPSAVVAGAGMVAIVLAASSILRDPRGIVQAGAQTVPPSGVGLHLRTQKAVITQGPPRHEPLALTGPVSPAELQREVEEWLVAWELSGLTVTLLRPSGEGWTGAAGVHQDGEVPFGVDERYHTASITKTFTAALILRMVEQGKLALDDTVERFVPDFPGANRFTVRQLIQHTSGLIATDGLAPAVALELAAAEGLQFEPGESFLYSSPGYFVLGLIVEAVEQRPYTRVLREDLLNPLQLTATFMDEEVKPLGYSTHPYSIGGVAPAGVIWSSGGLHRDLVLDFGYEGTLWSSAGLDSTTSDLARWALALWDGDQVVSAATRDAMTTFLGPEFEYAGLATYPYCPCWHEGERLRGERWGHLGLTGALEYDPADRVALAVSTSGTVVDEVVIVALDDLSTRLRKRVRGREMPILPLPSAVSTEGDDGRDGEDGGG